jgi:hypothetical protein
MAIKRDTPLSATPDPGSMQSYGKYEGPKMKTSKSAPLDSKPVNMKNMESKLKKEYDQNEDSKANNKSTKKFMKANAIGAGVLGATIKGLDMYREKYGHKGNSQ